MSIKTDNTMLTNGVIINNKFYPKKNLQSGTLRIVLTTQCNYKCIYCFAEGEKDKKIRIAPIDKLKKIIKVSKDFGITNIKLTGGEPLLYKDIEELLNYIRQIGIPYIDLTTNISMLNLKTIELLNKYNVNAITLSLNTLDKEKFQYLSKFKDFTLVQTNLLNTIKLFKGKIRINCVVFNKRYLKSDYYSIINFCKKNKIGLRIIEPSIVEGLPITYEKSKFHELINELKKDADKIIESDCNSVEYLFWGEWYLTIMHSLCDNKLCDVCPKYMYIRVTSELKLKPCLSREDTEIQVDFENEDKIRNSFIKAINKMGVGIKDEDK